MLEEPEMTPTEIEHQENIPQPDFEHAWNENALGKLRKRSIVRLLEALDFIKDELNKRQGLRATYSDGLRRRHLALNVILNEKYTAGELGAVAPVLRPQPTVPRGSEISGMVSDFLNDRQLIDLHFFWCCGHRTCSHEDGWNALAGTSFDFNAAFRFSRYGGSREEKLDALGLLERAGPGFCRFGAQMLRTDNDKQVFERITKGIPGTVTQLNSSKTSNNANHAAWADRYAAGKVLIALDAKVSGPLLKVASSLLFVHQELPRNDSLKRDYNQASKYLGAPR